MKITATALTASILIATGALLGGTQEPPAAPDDFRPDPSWKSLGPSIWFDPAGRRLVIRARVCLTEGYLEHLLCSARTKEHESILSTPAPPRAIHAGLLLTGAEKGHPVRFVPDFAPPTGSPIAIELEWTGTDGKPRRADAKTWVRRDRSEKLLDVDWVFAGSDLFKDPISGEMVYAADGGDLITVANFMSAILDLPLASSASDEDRSFVANTAVIPPKGTPVTMYLRPRSPAAADAGEAPDASTPKEPKEPAPDAERREEPRDKGLTSP